MRKTSKEPDEQDKGFVFPGKVKMTIIGDSQAGLEKMIPLLLEEHGLSIAPESLQSRQSRKGNYISVTVEINCPTREKYESAHQALRAEEAVKYTL